MNLTDLRPEKPIKDIDAMRRFHLEMTNEPCEVCERRVGTRIHHAKYRSRGGSDVPIDEKGRRQFLWVCAWCDADHGDLPSISRYD